MIYRGMLRSALSTVWPVGEAALRLVLAIGLLAGCARPRGFHLLPAPHTAAKTDQAGHLTVEQEGWLAELCPFGAPVLGSYYQNEPVTQIVRGGYAISHYDRLKTPIWVCEHLTEDHVFGPLRGRNHRWDADPLLCSEDGQGCERGATDRDYTGSGYDRGHLAPNMNQRLDEDQKRETFYFSNAAPQVGKRFNQWIWRMLEERVATWVRDVDSLWTVTGVLYHEPEEDDAATADGYVYVLTIGNGVYVPTHYYKVVVWEKDGTIDAVAYAMENRVHSNSDMDRHIVPIRWIEQRLDVDFMPHLEPGDADALETVVGMPLQ